GYGEPVPVPIRISPPAPADATIAHSFTNTDLTLISGTQSPQTNETTNIEATQVPDAAPKTVVESNGADPGATLAVPAGRTVVSGAVSVGISGELSHDTAPLSVSGAGRPSFAPSE